MTLSENATFTYVTGLNTSRSYIVMVNSTDLTENETFRIEISDISGIYPYSQGGVHMIQMNTLVGTNYVHWSKNMESGPGNAIWSTNIL